MHISRIDIIGQNGNDAMAYKGNYKHGHAFKGEVSTTYASWRSMKDRCLNPNSHKWDRYGGRGISICEDWLGDEGFSNFLHDLGERPEGTTLGRIDNESTYSKGNCRWETPLQQANNTSSNVKVEFQGVEVNLEQAVRLSGIPRTTFYRRYYEGGLRGDDLFRKTCHMDYGELGDFVKSRLDRYGRVNYTKLAIEVGIPRKKLKRALVAVGGSVSKSECYKLMYIDILEEIDSLGCVNHTKIGESLGINRQLVAKVLDHFEGVGDD